MLTRRGVGQDNFGRGKVEAVCGGRLFVMEPGMQVAYSKGTGETEYKGGHTFVYLVERRVL